MDTDRRRIARELTTLLNPLSIPGGPPAFVITNVQHASYPYPYILKMADDSNPDTSTKEGRAQARKEQLAKLPHNRKRMRW